MNGERPSVMPVAQNEPIVQIVDWIMPLFSLSLTLMSRRHFGAQYLTPQRIFGAVVIPTLLIKLLVATTAVTGGNPFEGKWATELFTFLLIGAGIWRYLEMKHKELNGIRWYSKCRGISFKFWRKLPVLKHFPYFVQRWVEPVTWFMIGYACYLRPETHHLGWFLCFASIMLWLEEGMMQKMMLREWYNSMDGHIMSDNMRKSVLDLAPPEQTEGYWNPMASRLDLKNRARIIAREEEGFEEYLTRLDALVKQKGLDKQQAKEAASFEKFTAPLMNKLKNWLKLPDQPAQAAEENPPPVPSDPPGEDEAKQ